MTLVGLGLAVKEARNAKRYTQKQVALDLGISEAGLSRLENGKSSSDFGVIKFMRLLNYLGLELEAKQKGFGYTLEDAQEDNKRMTFK